MKKLIFTLGMILLSPVHAEEVSLPALCVSKKELVKVIQAHEEKPFATGFTSRLDRRGEVELFEFVIFVNPETKSFTVVEIHGKDKFCVLSAGIDFKPFKNTKPGI